MSGNGEVFGGFANISGLWHPAIVDVTGATTLLNRLGVSGRIRALSNDGSIAAGVLDCDNPPTCTSGLNEPFRWDKPSGGWNSTTQPSIYQKVNGPIHGAPGALSTSGVYVMGELHGSAGVFRYGGGYFRSTDLLTEFRDGSGDGEYILGVPEYNPEGAVLWPVGGTTTISITCPSGWNEVVSPFAVNSDGAIVTGICEDIDGVARMFRWESGTATLLSLPAGVTWAEPKDISADGSVIVGRVSGGDGEYEAMLWDAAGGIRTLRSELALRGLELANDTPIPTADFVSTNTDGTVIAADYDGNSMSMWRVLLHE